LTFNGANVSIVPSCSLGPRVDISGVVTSNFSVGAALSTQFSIGLADAHTLVGNASVDFSSSASANVGVGVTIPGINVKVGKNWTVWSANYSKNLAKWQVFSQSI
jgi:hypothetical protein